MGQPWVPYSLALFFIPLVAWSRDASVVVLALCAVAVVQKTWLSRSDVLAAMLSSTVVRLLVLMMFFAGLSLLWSPQFSPIAWVQSALTVMLSMFVCVGLQHISLQTMHKAIRPLFMAGSALLAVLLIERLSGGFLVSLHRGDEPVDQLFNVMNGGLVLMACLCIPTMCVLRLKTQSWSWPSLVISLCLALGFSYRMDAVPVAILVGLITCLLVQTIGPRAAVLIAVAVGLVSLSWAFFAVTLATPSLYGWFSDNIHPNWGHRIAIWGYASELIHQNLWLGHGFDSARALGQSAGLTPDPAGRTSFLHPHNGMIHLWLELGVAGVSLFGAATFYCLRSAFQESQNRLVAGSVIGTFTATATIWLLSFGVWQPWWIAVIGLAVASMIIIVRIADRIVSAPPN